MAIKLPFCVPLSHVDSRLPLFLHQLQGFVLFFRVVFVVVWDLGFPHDLPKHQVALQQCHENTFCDNRPLAVPKEEEPVE